MNRISSSIFRITELISRPFMALSILCLPVTSLPLLSNLMGGTVVAPASIIFVSFLFVFWALPRVLSNRILPGETKPLVVFIIVAVVASLMAFFLSIPSGKGNSIIRNELEGVLTLGIGASVYLVFLLWNRDLRDLAWTLGLVNITGLVIIIWSSIQLVIILFFQGRYPNLLVQLQSLWSTRHLLELGFRTRVTGFTYEPSWLAHQLNLVFLPYWLAATVTGYSVFKKFIHISVENILLLGGVVILFYSLSRIGLAAFIFALGFFAVKFHQWLLHRIKKRFQIYPRFTKAGRWISLLTIFILIGLYSGMILGMIVLMAQVDPRMARFLTLEDFPVDFFDFAAKVSFLERAIYWAAGFSLFSKYPILGVGLGNSGFFFTDLMSPLAFRTSEIMYTVNEAAYLANIKNIWVRIMAETGLVGFSLFVTWQAILWKAGQLLRRSQQILLRTLGWMGAFVILAFIVEGFSVDSFALPYMWVSTGILTAASVLVRKLDPKKVSQ